MIARWEILMLGGAATAITGLLGGLSAESAGNPWAMCMVLTGMLGVLAMGIGFADSIETWGL